MKTDTEVIATRDHTEMIKRDHLWRFQGREIKMAVLALKRRNDFSPDGLELGCIVRVQGEPRFRIRLGNLFAIAWGVNVNTLPFIDYDSAEAITAAGWVVD